MHISRLFKILLLFIPVLFLPLNSNGQRYVISGIVTGKESGDTLSGVNIYLPETMDGAISDFNGRYSLSLPAGNHRVIFSFVGYESLEKTVILNKDLSLDAELKKASVQLGEVTVSSGLLNRNTDRPEMGTFVMDIETMLNIPAFLGEVDLLRTVQMLPGVHSAGDGNTGFFVRGGTADQNLVLFDDAVVFNPSHLFNFFSVFNPDAVRGLKLHKGGIPPSYGGRLSSVLDISMKEGNKEEFELNGGVGLISSRLSLEGPLQEGKSSFLIAGRRTYADIFLKLSTDPNQRQTQLYFYDLNGKMNYVVDEKNLIYISGYYGRDVTAFRDVFAFDWGNAIGSIRWNHLFSDKFTGNFSLIYSDYGFNISGNAEPAIFTWESSVSNINLQTGFTYLRDEDSRFSFGINSIYHNVDPGIIRSGFGQILSVHSELTASRAFETGTYFRNEQRLWGNRLAVDYGLRISMFLVAGPGRQYEFDREHPDYWPVTDTLLLGLGKLYDRFYGWEPRVSLRLNLGTSSSIKAGYNRMTQYIQHAQSSQSVAPYDAWFMSSNNIPPQTADQVVVGYFHNFFSDRVETSVEVYYKDFKNISDIIDNGDILGNEFLESQLRIGRGWAYGSEFLIRGSIDRFDGFIGYTWAWTRRKIEGINQGRSYFSPFDRRHDLSLSGGYKVNPKLSMSVNFLYASGRAFTFPVGRMRFQGDFAPIYAERNSGNLPDYHRLDLSVNFTPGRGNANRRFQSTWNFSVFNVYARVNPISVSFKGNEGHGGMPKPSFFYIPGPIPAVTWNFNY
jgi:hypothetical protein